MRCEPHGGLRHRSHPDCALSHQGRRFSMITYRTLTVDGLNIFYREAGPKDAPTIVLLHGFPSSSHMFRELIPRLSDKYHVLAPDYPGYGYSDAPSLDQYAYTFDQLADTVDHFLDEKGITK